MPNIHIRGVQMHIGSQITAARPFAEAIAKIAPTVLELKKRYAIEFLSIGGGMGIVYKRALESGTGKWWHDHEQRRFRLQRGGICGRDCPAAARTRVASSV